MEKFILVPAAPSLRRLIFILPLVLGLTACGGKEKEEEDKAKLQDYTVVSGTVSESSNNGQAQLDGSGVVRFLQTLMKVEQKTAFALDASLLQGNSSVTLIAFANNYNLTDGVHVQFVRTGNLVDVYVKVNAQGVRRVKDSQLTHLYPNDLKVVVDIHNSPGLARVLLWRQDMVSRTPASAEFDTANAQYLDASMPNEGGQGVFAGLQMSNAIVTNAQIKKSNVE